MTKYPTSHFDGELYTTLLFSFFGIGIDINSTSFSITDIKYKTNKYNRHTHKHNEKEAKINENLQEHFVSLVYK